MGRKTTVNAKNLEALGVERLAELLIEISQREPATKRRLRLELAGTRSSGEVAKEVRNRLSAMARSQAFVDWRGIRTLAEDLDTQLRAIIHKVAESDPKEALDLFWRLMGLAPSIFERCDDSNGTLISIFHEACSALGKVALKASQNPLSLADRAFDALNENGYGQFDELIRVLTPALGKAGLEHLRQRMIDLSNRPVMRPATKDRVTVGWSSSGPIYEDEMAESARASTVHLALIEIADALGDVDAYIEQHDLEVRKRPRIAADIAQRLLAAGRVEEAWQTIEATEHSGGNSHWDWPDFTWEDARIDVLEALGRVDDAQATRWKCFERSLSAAHLRTYLNRLPDFDAVEGERKALDHARAAANLLQALSFLVSWPALDRAAGLILERTSELDGDHYEILTPAAEALAGKHPLAATLLLRAMIDFSLENGRSSRYRHAARHLLDCSGLSSGITDYRSFEPHDAYEARLRREHGRKSSFWNLL